MRKLPSGAAGAAENFPALTVEYQSGGTIEILGLLLPANGSIYYQKQSRRHGVLYLHNYTIRLHLHN